MGESESKVDRKIKFRVSIGNSTIGYELLNDGVWKYRGIAAPYIFGTFASKDCKRWQYTGLKDREGTEIYEGDILAYFKTQINLLKEFEEVRQRKLVEWKAVHGVGVGFNISPPRKRRDGSPPQNNWKVIGNVYQNPELLK